MTPRTTIRNHAILAVRAAATVVLGALLFSWMTAPAALAAAAPDMIKPNLSIPIPGLRFSEIKITNSSTGETKTRIVDIPFLADYIAAVYKFGVGIASIIAAVMMMVGGFQYMTAGGDMNRVSAGKDKISNALIGLVLSLGAYSILYAVNPDLLTLKGMKIKIVNKELYVAPPEAEPDSVSGSVATKFGKIDAANVIGVGKSQIPEDLAPKIEAVAADLNKVGIGMSIASSFRTPEKQQQLISENCQNPPGSATCNPKPGKAQTCIMQNGPSSCPHTTGRALDVWAVKKQNGEWNQCVTQKQCLADKASCFNDACQKVLIAEMRKQGFCVLGSEPWHFEQPKMSGNCT